MRSKSLTIATFVLIGATGLAFAGKDYFASPQEPHGVVTGIVELPAKELWAVNITEINGERTPREQGVWLKPGTYTVKAKASGRTPIFAQSRGEFSRVGGVDRRRTTAVGGDTRTRDRDDFAIEIEVEAGKTYHIALDTSSPNRRDWKLVNWRVE